MCFSYRSSFPKHFYFMYKGKLWKKKKKLYTLELGLGSEMKVKRL